MEFCHFEERTVTHSAVSSLRITRMESVIVIRR